MLMLDEFLFFFSSKLGQHLPLSDCCHDSVVGAATAAPAAYRASHNKMTQHENHDICVV